MIVKGMLQFVAFLANINYDPVIVIYAHSIVLEYRPLSL
jgi:hypothetical protein